MTTLTDCLKVAREHWDNRSGGVVMGSMASQCVRYLGEHVEAETLGTAHAVTLLSSLRKDGYAAKTVQSYYGAFRRMLKLNGIETPLWPNAPTPPRKTRDRLKEDDLDALIAWFRAKRWDTTADLAVLLRATGLRAKVEGLTSAHLRYVDSDGGAYGTLHVTGKGGHERLIPIVDPEGRRLLSDPDRLHRMRQCSYPAHLDRWGKGVSALGITSRLATMHAVRHGYACDAYRKSGGDISMVQDLLGHASPVTTAKYLGTDLATKAGVLSLS